MTVGPRALDRLKERKSPVDCFYVDLQVLDSNLGIERSGVNHVQAFAFGHDLRPQILIHVRCVLSGIEDRISALEPEHEANHSTVEIEVHQQAIRLPLAYCRDARIYGKRRSTDTRFRWEKRIEKVRHRRGNRPAREVLGKTAEAILRALIRGESDPEKLADLAQGSLKKKRAELIEADIAEFRGPPVKEEDIREEPNQLVQGICHEPANEPNRGGKERDQHHAKLRRFRTLALIG